MVPGAGLVGPLVLVLVDGDGAWSGGQGTSDLGEGVVGVVGGGGGDAGVGAEGEAPGDVADVDTAIASFWPD